MEECVNVINTRLNMRFLSEERPMVGLKNAALITLVVVMTMTAYL